MPTHFFEGLNLVDITIEVKIWHDGEIEEQVIKKSTVPAFMVLEQFKTISFNMYSISEPAKVTLTCNGESITYKNNLCVEKNLE